MKFCLISSLPLPLSPHVFSVFCSVLQSHSRTARGRSQHALAAMGGTVLGGGITTFGSGAFLFPCQIGFFTTMAWLITMTILVGLVLSIYYIRGECGFGFRYPHHVQFLLSRIHTTHKSRYLVHHASTQHTILDIPNPHRMQCFSLLIYSTHRRLSSTQFFSSWRFVLCWDPTTTSATFTIAANEIKLKFNPEMKGAMPMDLCIKRREMPQRNIP